MSETSAVQSLLRELPFFQQVDAEQLPVIEAAGEVRDLPADTLLFSEGDLANAFFLILKGEVHITSQDASGKQQMLATMKAGDCFGEVALVEGGTRTASVITVLPSTFFALSQEAFFPLLSQSPRLLSQVMASVSQKMRSANQQYFEQRLQAQARQLEQEQQRQLLLQQLVTGMAHEFNTPLGILKTTASILSETLQEPEIDAETLQESCELIQTHVDRMGFLVQNLKAVSPAEVYALPSPMMWSDYFDAFKTQYEQSSYRNLPLKILLEPKLANQSLRFPDALDEILMNLLLNIEMHGYPDMDDSGAVTLALEKKAEGQVLKVIDTGKGVPEALRSQVQAPFFTTQRQSGAVGLGLTVSENIMHTLFKGSLSLAFPEQGGLCVSLYFPEQ